MTRRGRIARALGLALALSLGVAACARGEPEPMREPGLQATADQWLAAVAATHDEVDDALVRGERDVAASALHAALGRGAPPAMAAEDRRVVQQDLWYRLAEVELSRRDHDAALTATDAGLALGSADDVFVANLHIARARALEALGRDADAVASYAAALEINRALLDAALGRGDGGAR